MSVHNLRTECMNPGDVYVGRRQAGATPFTEGIDGGDGFFGNPFHIGIDGTREDVIARFETWARYQIKTRPRYEARVKALHGKRLFCYCAPLPCHANVLERLAAELNGVTP